MARQSPAGKRPTGRNTPPRRRRGARRGAARSLLWLILGVAVLLVFGIVLVNAQSNRNNGTTATVAVSNAAGMAWGPANAPVQITEYANFGCIHCRDFALGAEQQLRSEYANSGLVHFQFAPFQLGNPPADTAAAAAMCAADQGKFWQYHDVLYQQQTASADPFSTSALEQYASQLGLNTSTFDSCLTSGKYLPQVYQISQTGQNKGVTGTPTFFINGNQVVGAVPYAQFKADIVTALQAKGISVTPGATPQAAPQSGTPAGPFTPKG
jgi:protein-disulfide isomerase